MNRLGENEINGVLWWAGWNPAVPVIGLTVLGLALGIWLGGVPYLLGLGFFGGLVVWGIGVSHVNSNWEALVDEFSRESESKAQKTLAIDRPSPLFTFLSFSGDSPILIECPPKWSAGHMAVFDSSASLDTGSHFDLKKRESSTSGSTKEIYLDNVETIDTRETDATAYLHIKTSAGDDLSLESIHQDPVFEAQRTLRKKVRAAR